MTLERSRRLIGGVWRYVTADESSGNGGSQPVQIASVNVSAAEIAAIHGANAGKVLIPAAGGRNYHIVHAVVLHYRFVSSAYAGSDSRNLLVGYGTDPTAQASGLGLIVPSSSIGDFSAATLLQQTADAYAVGELNAAATTQEGYSNWLAATIEDAPIALVNIGTAYAGGDSTLTARVWYSTIDGAPA